MTWWLEKREKEGKFNFRKFKTLRAYYGLSLKDVSDMTGISDTFLWEIEQGFKNPSEENALKIQKALTRYERDE